MRRKLEDSVVVITGASSGIGRAAAHAFARRGARVVVAARREQALRDVVTECEALGGRALAVPTDVTDELAVQGLAHKAADTFGHIDVWVNNAAVTLFGRLEEPPMRTFRRVIDTNLFGCVHGMRAALPYFRKQGGGVLINTDSVAGVVSLPYSSAYVTSQHAIRALGMSVRQELYLEGARDIHVCTLMPAMVDTPLLQQGANFLGRTPRAMAPLYAPETIARAMVSLAEQPRRELAVGRSTRAAILAGTVAPGLDEHLMARQVERSHFLKSPAVMSSGNLFEPMPEYASVRGGWRARRRQHLRRLAIGSAAAVVSASWFYRSLRRSMLVRRILEPLPTEALARAARRRVAAPVRAVGRRLAPMAREGARRLAPVVRLAGRRLVLPAARAAGRRLVPTAARAATGDMLPMTPT